VPEGATAVAQATASDPEGAPLTFLIAGGPDGAQFRVDGGGNLAFLLAPNFEAPTDANGDNAYEVQVAVSDGPNRASASVRVSVENSKEGVKVSRVATGFSNIVAVQSFRGQIIVAQRDGSIYLVDATQGIWSTGVPLRTWRRTDWYL
jgi:hypothetical protein